MVTQLQPQTDTEIIYPDSDGQPMADNTIQFRWITVIYYNLAWLFANNSNVFVAGDLLWYPVERNNKLRQAPDVMVVFGVEKGDRGSYKQWQENNIAPQVVFEILSPGNTSKEMNRKLLFYHRYGVLRFQYGNVNFQVDLALERIVAAEREGEKIAVEIKSFLNPSAVTDFYPALGQGCISLLYL